jgi:uncharacterized protein YecE (DUF72 family)
MENSLAEIRFGTCSWKYDSWKGIIYPYQEKINYLEEYAKNYNSVEVDQWFWSLFDKVVLPAENVVNNYASSVPDDFLFTIKVPNSLTLTHYYKQNKKNPFFLSNDLFEQFLVSIEPLLEKTGMLMFQFEYMNKQKMPALNEFMTLFRRFCEALPSDIPPIGVEIRNPNFINENWFSFLCDLKITNVFLEGYFMPPVTEIYKRYKKYISGSSVIRLHGPDRSGIEEQSNNNWSKIYINREESLRFIAGFIKDLQERTSMIYVNVNNHYEGCAPETITRLKNLLK